MDQGEFPRRARQSLSLPVYLGDDHPCPYLTGRSARNEFTITSSLEPHVYQMLMDSGFRRSGIIVYRPVCSPCRECIPLRVPVERFEISRSQRRVLKRNQDVTVEMGPPDLTPEKWELYSRYLRHQHDGTMSDSMEDLEEFLYSSATTTFEMSYRVEGRLVAVGIIDIASGGLSSVYFFFDPGEGARSLGTFGALREIEECRLRGIPHWYVGYYVAGCRRMNYKVNFRPHEILTPEGAWAEVALTPGSSPEGSRTSSAAGAGSPGRAPHGARRG